ncbi:MAG TPA: sugar phosphate isomerase/epimerase family protein [Clostridia bacterium]|nr:sugar phosphate isomerase/epimerase family protein [Clostridia bacterium]
MNILSQTISIQFDTVFSPYRAAEWRAAFADVAEKGLSGVELAVAYPDRVDAADVLVEARKHGLAVTTLSTGQIYGLEGLYLTAPDRDIRVRAAAVVRGHIDLSTKLGSPNVTIGLLRGKLEPGGKDVLEAVLADSLAPLCAYAGERGVALQLEAINRSETSLINTTAEALAFLDKMGNPPSLGLLYDTYHSNLEDGDMLEAIRAAGGRIKNVHLADSHRGLPGEGKIDFASVVRALVESGYTGAFALETLCIPTREHILEHYASAIKSVAGTDIN